MVESMQQSSTTPSLHLGFLGLRKIVACSQPYLAVASCIYSFWHGVIPTSHFIFNDFYTCIISGNGTSKFIFYGRVEREGGREREGGEVGGGREVGRGGRGRGRDGGTGKKEPQIDTTVYMLLY